MVEDASQPAPGGSLSGLLEIERLVEDEIARAEAEAERRVEAAREALREASEGPGAVDDDALREVREAVARECDEAIRILEQGAADEVARYRDVDDRTLDALATWVAGAVATGAAPG